MKRVVILTIEVIIIGIATGVLLKGVYSAGWEDIKQECREQALTNQIAYKDTEYAGLDFYQFCIDNIRYSSPLNRPHQDDEK